MFKIDLNFFSGPVIVDVDLTVETTANAVLAAVESLALVAAAVAVHKKREKS